MPLLQDYAIVGGRDFLSREEDFLAELNDGDFKAVQEGYITWLSDPYYSGLKTKKIANGKNGFSLWESRMTKRIRLRFLVNEPDKARMPSRLDNHEDNRKSLSSLFGRAQREYWVATAGNEEINDDIPTL